VVTRRNKLRDYERAGPGLRFMFHVTMCDI